MRKEIRSEKGAPPKGAYSPAILAEGRMAFVSGQGPVDPETGELRLGSFAEQAKLGVLLGSALSGAAGLGLLLASSRRD